MSDPKSDSTPKLIVLSGALLLILFPILAGFLGELLDEPVLWMVAGVVAALCFFLLCVWFVGVLWHSRRSVLLKVALTALAVIMCVVMAAGSLAVGVIQSKQGEQASTPVPPPTGHVVAVQATNPPPAPSPSAGTPTRATKPPTPPWTPTPSPSATPGTPTATPIPTDTPTTPLPPHAPRTVFVDHFDGDDAKWTKEPVEVSGGRMRLAFTNDGRAWGTAEAKAKPVLISDKDHPFSALETHLGLGSVPEYGEFFFLTNCYGEEATGSLWVILTSKDELLARYQKRNTTDEVALDWNQRANWGQIHILRLEQEGHTVRASLDGVKIKEPFPCPAMGPNLIFVVGTGSAGRVEGYVEYIEAWK